MFFNFLKAVKGKNLDFHDSYSICRRLQLSCIIGKSGCHGGVFDSIGGHHAPSIVHLIGLRLQIEFTLRRQALHSVLSDTQRRMSTCFNQSISCKGTYFQHGISMKSKTRQACHHCPLPLTPFAYRVSLWSHQYDLHLPDPWTDHATCRPVHPLSSSCRALRSRVQLCSHRNPICRRKLGQVHLAGTEDDGWLKQSISPKKNIQDLNQLVAIKHSDWKLDKNRCETTWDKYG